MADSLENSLSEAHVLFITLMLIISLSQIKVNDFFKKIKPHLLTRLAIGSKLYIEQISHMVDEVIGGGVDK